MGLRARGLDLRDLYAFVLFRSCERGRLNGEKWVLGRTLEVHLLLS